MSDSPDTPAIPFNPLEMSETWLDIAMRSQRIAWQVMSEHLQHPNSYTPDPFNLATAYNKLVSSLLTDPTSLLESQSAFYRDSIALWQNTVKRMLGADGLEPVIEPKIGDNRFRDEQWSDHFLFDHIKQTYLLAARLIESAVDKTNGLDRDEAEKLQFFTRQLIDALAPTNFAPTNPKVVRETMKSLGKNLIHGMNNLLADLEKGDGQLRISMTDVDAFKLGENVATTPGKIVFQNRMFQLIQYSPTTDEVFKRPLLIVPPWINKYYIMDLQPKNSLIKWLVAQGHTVFVISWVNPDESYADTGYDEYVSEGLYAALDAVERGTDEQEVNAIGYCLGGTLLASVLAHMAGNGDERIKSATFFTSMIDFEEPGELGVFIDDQQVTALEERMQETGYLDASCMASTFNMLRANDLIWTFAINNYLLGQDPLVFDLLYWNSDSTRMPAAMHSFYLRKMYLENRLREPGGITITGTPIDICDIDIPVYFLSTQDDHIAPWKSTYAGAKLLSGPVHFVLGASGHIAGVINPPAANKYHYWTNRQNPLPDSAEQWLDSAVENDGSWWTDWASWVAQQSREKVPARRPVDGELEVIEDAPGSYVSKRIT